MQNNTVQTYLTRLIATEIAANLDTKITIDRVSITFINRFQLNNLYVQDQRGDTLLFAPKINVVLKGANFNTRTFTFRRATLYESFINFATDMSGEINLKFIVDYLKNPDAEKKGDKDPWRIKIEELNIENSHFILSNERAREHTGGIDLSRMDMQELNLSLNNFRINGDSLSMFIRDLSLNEKSGFTINSFSSDFSLSKDYMLFENTDAKTRNSKINSPYIHFQFRDYQDFEDVINLVDISIDLEPAEISFIDIAYFAPELYGYDEEFEITGSFSGRINDITGRNVLLHYRESTVLETNFNMIGLPDFRTTFMNFDIQSFITTNQDIENFKVPVSLKKIELPENLRKLGEIHYSGNYTGYPDDFVAYGRFTTDLGNVSTDILLKPGADNTLTFTGRLKTTDFKIGILAGAEEKVDRISMDGNINGFSSKGKLFANIESTIDSFRIFGYNYQNINILGTLTETGFSGSFDVSDPNINLVFSGRADFSDDNPEYAFTANVVRARPYYLNLYEPDPTFFFSFLLETNMTGKNIDELSGELSLVNALFSNSGDQIQIYDFNLTAVNYNGNSGEIIIRSDLMDGEIKGDYQFSTFPASLKKLVHNYIPSLAVFSGPVTWTEDSNNFSYHLRFKEIQPFVQFFFRDYDLGNNSVFTGLYDPAQRNIDINGRFPLFTFKDHSFKDITISASASEDIYNLNASSSEFVLKNQMKIMNILVNTEVFTDTIDVHVSWDNRETPAYSGSIGFLAAFDMNWRSGNPKININTRPSSFVFNDTVWHISESLVVIDSSSVRIDTLGISNQRQDFFVSGSVSKNPEDILFMKFSDMDIATFNIFTSTSDIILGGLLSGEASLQDALNRPIFLSDLKINELEINNENLGYGIISATWNNLENKVSALAHTISGENKQLMITGDYYPEEGNFDFEIEIDKLRMNMFEPFLADLISELRGLGSGKLSLTGTTSSPRLDGLVQLQKSSMRVDYLMTRYNFTNEVKIVNNNILFNDFELYDRRGNKASVQGTIYTTNLKNLRLDLRLTTNNFNFLNTTSLDNDLFYGEVNASGIIRFSGPVNDLLMDINARTERNSVFFIPLYGADELYEHDFIQWITRHEEILNGNGFNGSAYEVRLQGLRMNFNLEITPDLQVQLIFDPKVGDRMRGWGRGNLRMAINTMGRFEIYGDMLIERGDYLFTLKNLINKYFEVQRGGTISWSGDPTDANLDIQAVYRLKASLYPISPEPMETLRRRIPVDVLFNMRGKLMNPLINPNIELPTADQETRNILSNRISTDEEMMKQFLSLLVMNNFYSDNYQGGIGGTAQRGSGIAGSELFTNQLSNWLSQLSTDFDIGVNYRPGDELTSDQLELALSTQFLNDRIRINTNVGVGGTQSAATPVSNPNSIVGDFDIDFQITESGKLHVKAFNRSNDNLLIRTSPYTQGVGFTYREDFNTVGELYRRYREAVGRLFSSEKRAIRREEYEEEEDEFEQYEPDFIISNDE